MLIENLLKSKYQELETRVFTHYGTIDYDSIIDDSYIIRLTERYCDYRTRHLEENENGRQTRICKNK